MSLICSQASLGLCNKVKLKVFNSYSLQDSQNLVPGYISKLLSYHSVLTSQPPYCLLSVSSVTLSERSSMTNVRLLRLSSPSTTAPSHILFTSYYLILSYSSHHNLCYFFKSSSYLFIVCLIKVYHDPCFVYCFISST